MSLSAVDPGLTGAYAMSTSQGVCVQENYPESPGDPKAMIEDMIASGVTKLVCESISGGMSTSQTSAINFGRIKERTLISGIAFIEVHPMKWKRAMGLVGSKSDTPAVRKARSISLAKELFPTVSLKRTEKCKDSSDFAEALLLMEYARRVNL